MHSDKWNPICHSNKIIAFRSHKTPICNVYYLITIPKRSMALQTSDKK